MKSHSSSGSYSTSTIAGLRRQVNSSMRHKSPYLVLGVVCIGFIAFIWYYEFQTKRQAQQQVEQYAKLLESHVWKVDKAGAEEFVNLLLNFERFRAISIYHEDGELFIQRANPRPVGNIEAMLTHSGLIRDHWMAGIMYHHDDMIGRVEATWINRNIYTYSAVAVIMGMVTVLFFLLRSALQTIAMRQQSQQRLEKEISARRRVQEALSRSREMLESVVSVAPIILFALDREGKLTFCEGRGLAHLGLHQRNVIGQPFSVICGDDPRGAEDVKRALRGETFTSYLEVSDVDLESWYAPYRRDGNIEGIIGVCMDISEIKQAERQLITARDAAEAANEAKSNFLANISHELRTPLNSIIGFALVLKKNKQSQLSADELHYIERIQENGKHLFGIINQILDLSKIETGRLDLHMTKADLRKMALDVRDTFKAQADEHGIALEVDVPDELQPLKTDAGKLRQILYNLVGNAVKFTHDGSVTIRIHADDERLPCKIEVIDTGIGIPEDKIDEIFQAFHQIDNQITRKYSGTGLGLTVSRTLCDLLGYELSVSSEKKKGSTFTILIFEREGAATPIPGLATKTVNV